MQKMKRIVAWIALVAVLLSSFAFAEESVPVETTAPVETELVLEAPEEEAAEEPAEELTEEPTEEIAEEPAEEEAPAEETPVEEAPVEEASVEEIPEAAVFSVMTVDEHEHWMTCENPGVCADCGVELNPEEYNFGHDTYIPEEDRDNWVDVGDGMHALKCFRCGEEYNHGEHGQSCNNPGVCWDCGIALNPDEYGIAHDWWNEEQQRDWVIKEDEPWKCGLFCKYCKQWIALFDHNNSCANPGVCDRGCGAVLDSNDWEIGHNDWIEEEGRQNWVVNEDGLWTLKCVDCGYEWEEHECWVRCGNEGVCGQCGNPCDLESNHDSWIPEEERNDVRDLGNGYCAEICQGCGIAFNEGPHGISCDAADKTVCSGCGTPVNPAEAEEWHPVPDWTQVPNPANPREHGAYCPGCDQVVHCGEHWAICNNPGVCAECGIEINPEEYDGGHDDWIDEEERQNWIVTENGLWALQCLVCGEIWEEHWCWVRCGNEGVCDQCGNPCDFEPEHDSWDRENERQVWVDLGNGWHAEACAVCGFTWNEGPHGVDCTAEDRSVCSGCGASIVGMEVEDWHNPWIEEEQRDNWVDLGNGMHALECIVCGFHWEENWHGVDCQAEDKSVCSGCGISVEGMEVDDWHDDWIDEEERDNWIVTENGKWALQCLACGEIWDEHDCWVRCGNEGVCDQCGNPCDFEPEHDSWNREEDRPNCYAKEGDLSVHIYVCDGCGEVVDEGPHGVSCEAEDKRVCSDCGISLGDGIEYEEWHNDWLEEEQRQNWVDLGNGMHAIECVTCGYQWDINKHGVECTAEDKNICSACGANVEGAEHDEWHDTWNEETGRDAIVDPNDPNMHISVCKVCGEIVYQEEHGTGCWETEKVCSGCGVEYDGSNEWHDSENWDAYYVDPEDPSKCGQHCQVCDRIVYAGDHWTMCDDMEKCYFCGTEWEFDDKHTMHSNVEVEISEDESQHIVDCMNCDLYLVEDHFYGCYLEDRSACAECGYESSDLEVIHPIVGDDGYCAFCGEYVVAEGVTAVEILPAISTVAVGQEESIGVLVTGHAEKIEYKSSNAKVLAVDENGVLTAKKTGTATITVTAIGADGTTATTSAKITVKKAPTKVALSDKTKTIGVGEVVTLTAKLSPSGAYSAIAWTSSDESVVQVNADGEIYGAGEGSATITAETFNGKKASCKVEVLGAPAELTVDVTELKLNVKKTYTLKVEAKSAAGGKCAGTLSYASADTSVATVDAKGKITAKKLGETTITVSTYNGLVQEVKLGVYNAPKKVTLNVTKETIEKGATLQIVPSIGEDEYTTYTYSTNAKKVATVDASGLVTALAEGTATITVKTANSKKATAKITVIDPYKPTGVELAETGTVMLSLGETLQLNASLLPTTAKSELTWSTSAKKTATVDENGLVTPVKEGTVTITVKTYNGKKDTVKVQVVDPKKVAAVELAESGTVTLNLGETLELHATVLPATAETTLSWSSKNARIATVADGIVTPVKEGTTEITVKSANGKKDSVKVKVVDPKKATAVVLSEEGTVSIGVGEIYVLTAEVQPGTAETTLKWSTSNKKYVIVEEGAVLGVKAGTATITVQTANGKKDTVKVKVVDETAKASYSSFIGDWKLDRVGYMGVSIPAEGLLDGFGLNITKDSISMSFENETETTTEWTMDGGVLVLDGGSYAVSCRLYGKSMLCMDMVEVASGEVVSAWFVK